MLLQSFGGGGEDGGEDEGEDTALVVVTNASNIATSRVPRKRVRVPRGRVRSVDRSQQQLPAAAAVPSS